MRKVYASCSSARRTAPLKRRQARRQFQFLCTFYMPTVNCCPATPARPLWPPYTEVQRPEALTNVVAFSFSHFCLWSLSKFHVRNRHKSYGHILNLCAPHKPTAQATIFHTPCYAYCGCVLWLRLLSSRHLDGRLWGSCRLLLLIFAAAYWICLSANKKVF